MEIGGNISPKVERTLSDLSPHLNPCSLSAPRRPTIRSCVVLMLVQKPSNLLFQRQLTSQSVVGAASSRLHWLSVGSAFHCRSPPAKTPQHALFSSLECQSGPESASGDDPGAPPWSSQRRSAFARAYRLFGRSFVSGIGSSSRRDSKKGRDFRHQKPGARPRYSREMES